ncbi:hypothetical protein LIT38_25755 [Bacillus sp. CMF12]|uniref:hypothetical protein n=1 Tax=Bacillus sp. CMF12 TaxID=2884834 RepID=UPI0020796B46|nr:hypothetical protein [Bacillus sp. CMF12]USK49851.1 hypothetical protein LIT38_25755 [Bacillus sp. CMF12]
MPKLPLLPAEKPAFIYTYYVGKADAIYLKVYMNAWSKGIRLAHCEKKWKNTSIHSEEEKKCHT